MSDIIPTVVPESFEDIVRVTEQYQSFAHTIHVDVADGKFAPNTTWMPAMGEKLPPGMKYEIHMMVEDPQAVGLLYIEAGAHSLIGHVEAFKGAENAKRAFDAWKTAGVKEVQSAALLHTELTSLASYVPISDLVLLMTIASIGVQGIPFEASGIERVAEFKKLHPDLRIAVDGGVSLSNIERLAKAGATHFCAGSSISKAPDHADAYQQLLTLANGV